MKVEVYYRNQLVWNFEAPTPEDAKARAERGGHAVTSILTGKDGVLRVSSEKPDGYVEVSGHELNQNRDAKVAAGESIFNGCTGAWLAEKYGADNVLHVMGVGYFRRSKRGRKS